MKRHNRPIVLREEDKPFDGSFETGSFFFFRSHDEGDECSE